MVRGREHFGSLECCLGECFLGIPHSLRVKEVVGSEWKDGCRLILLEDIVGAARTPRCTGMERADEDQRRLQAGDNKIRGLVRYVIIGRW